MIREFCHSLVIRIVAVSLPLIKRNLLSGTYEVEPMRWSINETPAKSKGADVRKLRRSNDILYSRSHWDRKIHFLDRYTHTCPYTRNVADNTVYDVIRIHESHIFVLRKIHFKQMKIIAVYTQLKQLRNKAWKKFRPERESNPWPLRYRCSALTNWAIKPTGSWSIVSSLYTRRWRRCVWCAHTMLY